MKITEIFKSIQGEGPNIGKPAIFIRTFGCNLRCDFCDTKYSYDSSSYKEMNIKEIKEEIIKHKNIKHIVFTGGEPMLQIEEIEYLIQSLNNDFNNIEGAEKYDFELETNGTIWDSTNLQLFDYISVSPKKGGQLKTFELSPKVIYKFVIESPESFRMWQAFIKQNHIKKEQVYLMPQSKSREEFIENGCNLVELCVKYGYRFAPRLHLILWGKKRGV